MYLLSFSLKRGEPFQFISSFLHYWSFRYSVDFPKDKYVKVPACLNSRYRYNSERVAVCGHKLAWHNNSIFIGFCWCSVGRRLAGAGPGGSIDIEYEAAAAASCPEPGSSQQLAVSTWQLRDKVHRVQGDLTSAQPHLSSVQPSVPWSTLSISCVTLVLQTSGTDA